MGQKAVRLRRRIKKTIDLHDLATVEEVVSEVSKDTGQPEIKVLEQLDMMERNGFVYLVERDDYTEVDIP